MTKKKAYEELCERRFEQERGGPSYLDFSDGWDACLNRVCDCEESVRIVTPEGELVHPRCPNCGGKIEEEL